MTHSPPSLPSEQTLSSYHSGKSNFRVLKHFCAIGSPLTKKKKKKKEKKKKRRHTDPILAVGLFAGFVTSLVMKILSNGLLTDTHVPHIQRTGTNKPRIYKRVRMCPCVWARGGGGGLCV